MSELISGEEAKKAWANGERVQWKQAFSWNDLGVLNMLGIFDADDIEFRLKPRTITLNGIEIPTPFEPKVGESLYVVSDAHKEGWEKVIHRSFDRYLFGAWETEYEIKQVVAALHKVFKGE